MLWQCQPMHVPETNETQNDMSAEDLKATLAQRESELAQMVVDLDAGRGHLILMVGLPYSGKTTKALSMGYPIVSPDAIRLALTGQRYRKESEPMVWACARLMVASLFWAGHLTVILDSCNGTQERRAEWEDERWRTTHVLIQTSMNQCLKRAERELDLDIIPVIERMAQNFDWRGWSPAS